MQKTAAFTQTRSLIAVFRLIGDLPRKSDNFFENSLKGSKWFKIVDYPSGKITHSFPVHFWRWVSVGRLSREGKPFAKQDWILVDNNPHLGHSSTLWKSSVICGHLTECFGDFSITNSLDNHSSIPSKKHLFNSFSIPFPCNTQGSPSRKNGIFLPPNICETRHLGHPLDVAGCFTAVTLRWMTPLASMSAERKLKAEFLVGKALARSHGIWKPLIFNKNNMIKIFVIGTRGKLINLISGSSKFQSVWNPCILILYFWCISG